FQVTPKSSHLQAVKRIFMYLKGQLKLGLWYPKVSSFDLEAYLDSDYAGENLDKKSTTGGLNSWLLTLERSICSYMISGEEKLDMFKSCCTIKENAQFHEIVDLLSRSSIFYALTVSPDVCASFIEQFCKIVTFKTISNISQIHAKVAGKPVVITEASIRGDLLFNDVDGIDCLTNEAIFENLALMGYEGDLTKLTFQKALFSPQWKFLIHTIIHCLSSITTSWDQFSTNIASVVICLATNRKFNFSKMIFDGMIRNFDAKKKFI
nr:ribonuclease H-like domain-containing protein [Tanacetum cinerariifolium]